MVRINNLSPNPQVEIFAKLEAANPMGSVKDRIALRMIKRAEEKGELTSDKTILEANLRMNEVHQEDYQKEERETSDSYTGMASQSISLLWVRTRGIEVAER